MLLRNKTPHSQTVRFEGAVVGARGYRTIEVNDNAEYNKEVFELVAGEKPKIVSKNKKGE